MRRERERALFAQSSWINIGTTSRKQECQQWHVCFSIFPPGKDEKPEGLKASVRCHRLASDWRFAITSWRTRRKTRTDRRLPLEREKCIGQRMDGCILGVKIQYKIKTGMPLRMEMTLTNCFAVSFPVPLSVTLTYCKVPPRPWQVIVFLFHSSVDVFFYHLPSFCSVNLRSSVVILQSSILLSSFSGVFLSFYHSFRLDRMNVHCFHGAVSGSQKKGQSTTIITMLK